MTEKTRTARRRGSRRHGAGVDRTRLAQMLWGPLQYTDLPTQPLDEEGVERVHDTAMRILEEIGVDFLNEEARDILKLAGCDVDPDGCRVRMDRGFVAEQVARAPSEFVITPRNPGHAIEIGGKTATFGSVASPPNVSDLDRGRRVGNRKDFQDLLKLTQVFNCIHFNSGYPVEPVDIHPSIRHLDCLFDLLTLTDKVVHAYSLGTERVEDAMEMVRIAAGLSSEEFDSSPRMFTNINSTSPLKHDWPMLDGAMRMARRGQAVVVAPFTLAGAMAPITLAGALAQQTAECLCAVALLQIVSPGAPVVFGAFTTNVDMKSGAPAFGTPEYMRAMQISGQMARRYGLPWRGSNANAANSPDGQSIWESVFSLWGVTSGHVNMVFHAAGWLEGGLVASFEKFVMDCELLQQQIWYHRQVGTSEEDLAIDAIRQVGSDGNFFDCDHTRERYRDAFYAPLLSDWRNFESWRDAGAPQSHQHANRIWKKVVAEFEPPEMDPAIRDELATFVARRKEEGGAPTDF